MKCKHLKTRSKKYRYYNYCTKLKKKYNTMIVKFVILKNTKVINL